MDEVKRPKVPNFLKLNRVIWLLTVSDIFSWGLYLPLSALIGLYLSQLLGVNTVEMVGIGVAIYYLTRSLSQIPIGFLSDKIKKDRDDLVMLILGNIFIGFPFLLFPLIEHEGTYYVLQMFAGLGASMNLVNWRKLFAKNLDKDKEGTSYAIYDTILSAAISVSSFVIGLVANISPAYFDFVMISVGLIIVSSSIWPALIFTVKDRRSGL